VILVANNLYRATTPQTAALSGVLILGLLGFYRSFNVRSESRFGYAQVLAIVSVMFALLYGIVGSYLMRSQFSDIETWTDAVYFTFVTYSTLGYGDMLPQTDDAKLFAVSMIVVGLGSFITAISIVAGPMLATHLKGVLRIMTRLQGLSDHVIVCGYSNVATSIMDELRENGVPYLVVEDRPDLVQLLQKKGCDVIVGDATKAEDLEPAGLKKAAAVIAAFDSDSVNTLVALTATEYRKANPDSRFRVIARVEDEPNIDKVRHIGVDEVISPSTLGGRMMAQKAIEAIRAPRPVKKQPNEE
jgi:voltage-gated potassium channel